MANTYLMNSKKSTIHSFFQGKQYLIWINVKSWKKHGQQYVIWWNLSDAIQGFLASKLWSTMDPTSKEFLHMFLLYQTYYVDLYMYTYIRMYLFTKGIQMYLSTFWLSIKSITLHRKQNEGKGNVTNNIHASKQLVWAEESIWLRHMGRSVAFGPKC